MKLFILGEHLSRYFQEIGATAEMDKLIKSIKIKGNLKA